MSKHFIYLIVAGSLTMLITGFSPPDPSIQLRNAAIALPVAMGISYLIVYRDGYKQLKQHLR